MWMASFGLGQTILEIGPSSFTAKQVVPTKTDVLSFASMMTSVTFTSFGILIAGLVT